MDMHCEMIMEDFRKNKPSYDLIKNIIEAKIKEIIQSNGMYVVAVEARVKQEKSLMGKLEHKGYKYPDISAITDLIGARVVTFYSDDVDKVAVWVEELFNIDWENSVDKRAALSLDQFGYMSVHYICQIPESMYKDPEHPEINETKFEIQIRTGLQHMWATAFHDTGYKSDIEIPKIYRRRLNRLAGLLEIADDEFESIKNEIETYRRRITSIINEGKFEDIDINADSWRIYMAQDPFGRLNERIALINHAEISPASAEGYIEVFGAFGLKTLADIEKLKSDNEEDAYQLARYQLGNTDLDIVTSTIGLQNLCIVKIIREGGGEVGLRMFFDHLYGERPRNAKSAARIMKVAESLNIVAREVNA